MPKVAYHRRLSAEGVLSLEPTVVIATTEVGPPEVIQQIKSTGVTMLILLLEPPVENTISNIQRIATLLKGRRSWCIAGRSSPKDSNQASISKPADTAKAKVLFIYARGQGTLMVAGQQTGADTIFSLSGGLNAIQGYTV